MEKRLKMVNCIRVIPNAISTLPLFACTMVKKLLSRSGRGIQTCIPTTRIAYRYSLNTLWMPREPIFVPQFCTDAGLTTSNGEARQSIKTGAFKVNGENTRKKTLSLEDGMIVQSW